MKLASLFASYGIRYMVNEYPKVEKHIPIMNKIIKPLLDSDGLVPSVKSKIIESADVLGEASDYMELKPALEDMRKLTTSIIEHAKTRP